MNEKLSNALTVVLVLCALTVTGLVIRREVVPRPASHDLAQGHLVEGWEALLDDPRAEAAEVRIVVFTDYTCTYCRDFEIALDSLQAAYGEHLAVRHRHFPRSAGGTAFDAAMAAECAAAQRHGDAFHRTLFAQQHALGVIGWDTLASLAAVPRPDAFRDCMDERRTEGAVRDDRARGQALGVAGTPTFLVDGRMYLGSRSFRDLERLVVDSRR